MSKFQDDDDRFDGLYLNVAQTTRGIEPLLDTVFSFLRRKTDFFAGPPGSAQDGNAGTQAAIQKVNEVLQKHAAIYEKEHAKKKPKVAEKKKKAPAKEKEEEEVIEMGTDGGFDVSSATATAKWEPAPSAKKQDEKKAATTPPPPPPPSSSPPAAAAKTDDTAKNEDDGDGDTEMKDPPPVGNGGTVEGKYVWTQTLSEVTVTIPVPESTRGRDLNVDIRKNHLKVGLRSSKEMIVDADLCKSVIMDDSFWTVEDGNRLVVNLQKLNQMEWWDCVCQGDAKINIQAIQPESSSLSDLDGETRKTVEKMMFDQRQKAMGLPSSDEVNKMAMLEKFKAQHPEMDFSNAKIS